MFFINIVVSLLIRLSVAKVQQIMNYAKHFLYFYIGDAVTTALRESYKPFVEALQAFCTNCTSLL